MHKEFTDAEKQAIRAESAARFDGRVLRVDLPYPDCDATVIVAPFDREGYASYIDAKHRDAVTAQAGAMLNRLLWPSFQDVEVLRQEWPVLAEDVSTQLVLEAGWRADAPRVERLNPKRPPRGLTGAEAASMIEKIKGKLWCVETPDTGLSCVMKSQLPDTWLAARTLDGDARAKAKGVIASTEAYVLGAVEWSREPLTGGHGLLDRCPAIYWDLWSAFLRLGGDGAAVSRKSL